METVKENLEGKKPRKERKKTEEKTKKRNGRIAYRLILRFIDSVYEISDSEASLSPIQVLNQIKDACRELDQGLKKVVINELR